MALLNLKTGSIQKGNTTWYVGDCHSWRRHWKWRHAMRPDFLFRYLDYNKDPRLGLSYLSVTRLVYEKGWKVNKLIIAHILHLFANRWCWPQNFTLELARELGLNRRDRVMSRPEGVGAFKNTEWNSILVKPGDRFGPHYITIEELLNQATL